MDLSLVNYRKYIALLVPSATSILLSAVIMLVVIVFRLSETIRQFIGIPQGIDLHGVMNRAVETVLNKSLGQNLTSTAVVAGFWAAVGLFVYFAVLGIVRLVGQMDENVYEEKRYLWPKGANRQAPLQEFIIRWAIRIAALAVAVFYVLFPLTFIVNAPPFGYDSASGTMAHQAMVYLVWFVTGLVVWHGFVVLVRLVALRSRLLG